MANTNTNTKTPLNYASVYSQSLANLWPGHLYFEAVYGAPNNGRFRWNGGKTVQLPTITTSGRVDADRDTIDTASRNYDNAWETKTLSHHRKWSTLIHPLDIEQTDYAASIANITTSYNINKKFPEMDAYCVSKLYTDWTGAGKTADTTALTSASVLSVFDSLMAAMDEAGVPFTGRILYVTPTVMNLLKKADYAYRTITSEDGSVSRMVSSLDGVQIVMVPAALMKTAYTFTEGYAAKSDALQINMLLLHPDAVVAPISYQFAQLDPPAAFSEGKYIYFEESCEDVFLLSAKVNGVQFNITPAATTNS